MSTSDPDETPARSNEKASTVTNRESFNLAETFVGFLLTLGLWMRLALAAGALLITTLVFGTALRSDWDTLGIQMIYAAIYYLLLVSRTYDRFSIDHLLRRNFMNETK